jgi:hypothetical protein
VLKLFDNGISDNGILRCLADEDGERLTALSHFRCPAAATASSRMLPSGMTGLERPIGLSVWA